MPIQAYTCGEKGFEVTPEIKADFDKKGYILVRKLLIDAELAKVKGVLENSDVIKEYAYDVDDGANGKSRMCLWNQPGDDVTGRLARSEKVAGTCEKLLGGEVYHYHSKLMMKEPYGGGRWGWHQDYGYWYTNTCLFPDMMTVFIAMDRCYEGNGCLRVLEGSHLCGRINHLHAGGQMGADMERVEMLKARCPELLVELNPGDALFFHCNLLHTSSQNNGPDRRWTLAIAFNSANNNPVKEHHHPLFTKLNKVPNSAILESGEEWDLAAKAMFGGEVRAKFFAQLEESKAKNKN